MRLKPVRFKVIAETHNKSH